VRMEEGFGDMEDHKRTGEQNVIGWDMLPFILEDSEVNEEISKDMKMLACKEEDDSGLGEGP